MGNDGGSIPTRRELVKEAARNPTSSEVKATKQEQQEYLWTTDPVSQKPLSRPVVSDANGKLYNKVTILEYLLEGKRSDEVKRETRGLVSSLKDIVEVKFEVTKDSDLSNETWICPITGERLGPGSKAVYFVPCGHAFSGAAVRAISEGKCMSCKQDDATNDAVTIIPSTEADTARLSSRIQQLTDTGMTHSQKKASGSKKRKKGETASEQPAVTNATAVEDKTSSINNASTATLTAKVLQAQDIAKKRKLDSDNVKSLFSNSDKAASKTKDSDFMTRGYSVPVAAKR